MKVVLFIYIAYIYAVNCMEQEVMKVGSKN